MANDTQGPEMATGVPGGKRGELHEFGGVFVTAVIMQITPLKYTTFLVGENLSRQKRPGETLSGATTIAGSAVVGRRALSG